MEKYFVFLKEHDLVPNPNPYSQNVIALVMELLMEFIEWKAKFSWEGLGLVRSYGKGCLGCGCKG